MVCAIKTETEYDYKAERPPTKKLTNDEQKA